MDVFAISPASAKPLWFLGVICVLLAVVLFALVYTAYSSRHSRVEIAGDRIKLIGDFWGRDIPKRRTLGTGLPGYASGWFRLRSGEKALVYLTRRRDVVYVPTSDGYSLLLSVEEPEKFIGTLQRYSP
jgi:hypothetical protein